LSSVAIITTNKRGKGRLKREFVQSPFWFVQLVTDLPELAYAKKPQLIRALIRLADRSDLPLRLYKSLVRCKASWTSLGVL